MDKAAVEKDAELQLRKAGIRPVSMDEITRMKPDEAASSAMLKVVVNIITVGESSGDTQNRPLMDT